MAYGNGIWITAITNKSQYSRCGRLKDCHTFIMCKFLPFTAHRSEFHYDTVFNPTIDKMRVVRKNNRQKDVGSLKQKMPTSTAPTAPMPVHTA